MSEINIQAILKKHLGEEYYNDLFVPLNLAFPKDSLHGVRINRAFKEALEAVIDKCSQNARPTDNNNARCQHDCGIDKQSILNVKNLIDYGTD